MGKVYWSLDLRIGHCRIHGWMVAPRFVDVCLLCEDYDFGPVIEALRRKNGEV